MPTNTAVPTAAPLPIVALVMRQVSTIDTAKRSSETRLLVPSVEGRKSLSSADGKTERLRITLAVAGFAESDLDVTTEENQLVVRGRQTDDTEREFLHRGIAARQFQRCFVLADGMRVIAAELKNGLLSIDLDRPESERLVRKINISVKD